MKQGFGKLQRVRGAAGLVLLISSAMLRAQSVSDYKLPGATPAPTDSRVQGPVDRDNPVIRPATPAATPGALPTVSSPARPVDQAPPAVAAPNGGATPRPVAPRPRAATPAPAKQGPASAPGASDAAAPVGTSALPANSGAAAQPPVPAAMQSNPPSSIGAQPVDETSAAGRLWPWLVAAAALGLAGLLGWLWSRRHAKRPDPMMFEAPVVPAIETVPEMQVAAPPPPAPTQIETPVPPTLTPLMSIALEARRMSASLMATTLSYRLTVTNHSTQPITALGIEGDMISAHASLPAEQQIASAALRLDFRHALVTLGAGESADFSGDFRLPLSAVTPIRSGEAAFFVPLARIRIEASAADGRAILATQTFVVGELPDNPDAALRPFRLDLGPRTYSRIGQRAVA